MVFILISKININSIILSFRYIFSIQLCGFFLFVYSFCCCCCYCFLNVNFLAFSRDIFSFWYGFVECQTHKQVIIVNTFEEIQRETKNNNNTKQHKCIVSNARYIYNCNYAVPRNLLSVFISCFFVWVGYFQLFPFF